MYGTELVARVQLSEFARPGQEWSILEVEAANLVVREKFCRTVCSKSAEYFVGG
jgi:hypothetical protein